MKKIIYFVIAIFIVAVSLITATIFFHKKFVEIKLPDSLGEQLGQSFIVGVDSKTLDEKTKEILQEIKPAGIVLYYRNYQDKQQFEKLISDLQQLAVETTGNKYFIMIDEEPGGATRLNLFENVFAFGTPDWARIEKDITAMQRVGINVDLAPIADFPFDNNSFIRSRVPAHKPDNLKEFNQQFISLLKKNNISATLKHFPGMGVFIDDPHKKLPYADPGVSVIDNSLAIFKSGIDAGANFVMTGHGVYDDIDPNVCATFSKKIVTDILRGQLGFEGIIITDDLSDMPFSADQKRNLNEAAKQALEAGHNLIMFSHQLERTKDVFDQLLLLTEKDDILKSIIKQNYIKVVSQKKRG
jgi:beta-N-acetylhexosaminidase